MILADEYRLRFKRAPYVGRVWRQALKVFFNKGQRGRKKRKNVTLPRAKGYTNIFMNGRMVTFINLLNHSKKRLIRDLYDSFEHEDLECALFRIDVSGSCHDDFIEFMLREKRKRKKQQIVHKTKKRKKKPSVAFFLGKRFSFLAKGNNYRQNKNLVLQYFSHSSLNRS